VIGLFGGAFDPPHNGHVALVAAAKERFGLERVVVIVTAAPGHKAVETPVDVRVALARAAFPDDEVVVDGHARTIDMLREHPEWEGALFLIGADELADFPSWKEPDEVLRLVRLGVAARPGYDRALLEASLATLSDPERVLFFELDEPHASRALRPALVADAFPPAVWELIEREGLYARQPGVH